MTRSRSDLVEAVGTAWAIVGDAIEDCADDSAEYKQEALAMRAAALPIVLRALLDEGVPDA